MTTDGRISSNVKNIQLYPPKLAFVDTTGFIFFLYILLFHSRFFFFLFVFTTVMYCPFSSNRLIYTHFATKVSVCHCAKHKCFPQKHFNCITSQSETS